MIVSKQVRYQQNHIARGLCALCSQPALGGSRFCLKHLVTRREESRRRQGSKKIYANCVSRQLEAAGLTGDLKLGTSPLDGSNVANTAL